MRRPSSRALQFADVLRALEQRVNGSGELPYTFALDAHDVEIRTEAWASCPVCHGPRLKVEDTDGIGRLDCLDGCARADVLEQLGIEDLGNSTLRRLDVARMVAEPPPAVPWVVEGLVVRRMLTVLNGREGEGKSLLTMALAAGVATGQDEAGVVCHSGPVVIVDAENGAWEIHRRVRTLDLPSEVAVFEADGFDLRNGLSELEAILAELQPALLVLDSFRSLWRGDENDSREVAEALDPLRNLVRRYDVGTILLHHSGKGNGAAYRGSSAIGASAELGFKLARQEDDDDRDRRYLECWKCRPAPEPERRWLRLAVEDGRVFVDRADPIESSTHEPAAAQPVRDELRPRVLDALTAEPQSRADIARAVDRDPKDRSVGRVLDALEAAGHASKNGPDARPKWRRAEGGIHDAPPVGARHPATFDANPDAERESGGGNAPATSPDRATLRVVE